MPRTGSLLAAVRGRSARVTRLDGCGRPVYGEYSQATTEGIVTAAFTANTTDTEEINVQNFAGRRRIYEPSTVDLAGYGLTLTFSDVDFETFEIITGQTLVLDAFGKVVGLEIDTAIPVDDSGFALEVWVDAQGTDVCDDPNAQGEWGYLLLPRLEGGIVGDFEVANGAVNFTITGANTVEGNRWGKGPYPVEMGAGTSEVQRVTITGTPTGGSFTLTYAGQTTTAIAYNATPAAVQTALEALSNVGVGDIVVTGGPGPGTPYTLTFANSLAERDVAQLTAAGSFTGGSSPAVAVTTLTPGVTGVAGTLHQAVSTTAALRLQVVTAAPPVEQRGARPLLNPASPAFTSIGGVEGDSDMEADFTTTPAATAPTWYDFGDGEWDYVSTPGAASHLYAEDGEYTVRASQNGVNWTSTTVTVPFP